MVLDTSKKKYKKLTYGIAMSTMFVATDMQAAIVDITWDEGLNTVEINGVFNSGQCDTTYYGTSTRTCAVPLNIDQIVGTTDLSIFNSFFSDEYDKPLLTNREISIANKKIVDLAFFDTGELISPTNFNGETDIDLIEQSGSVHVGFRTGSGNVGWFKVSLPTENFDMVFGEGKFATEGETLVVGGSIMGDVNCDGVVDMLDVDLFVELLKSSDFSPMVDFDGDGVLTLLDVRPFVDVLNGGGG